MKTTPFDINLRPKIEDGTYNVVTRKGLPARIICWDLFCKEYPIAAAYFEEDDGYITEQIGTFTPNGEVEKGTVNESDLFLLDGTITVVEKDYIECALPSWLKYRVSVKPDCLAINDKLTTDDVCLPWSLFLEIAKILKDE